MSDHDLHIDYTEVSHPETHAASATTAQCHEELYARYLEQQRRMACPGCGEEAKYISFREF